VEPSRVIQDQIFGLCRNRDRGGTAKIILKKKQMSRHHSLLWKTIEKP